MARHLLTVTYDTGRPAGWLGAYRLTIGETEDIETDRLMQIGPVQNNRAYYRGVFKTRDAALRAALDYIGQPCKLLSVRPWGERAERLVVQAHGERASFPEADVSVAASRNANGVFVSA